MLVLWFGASVSFVFVPLVVLLMFALLVVLLLVCLLFIVILLGVCFSAGFPVAGLRAGCCLL